MAHAEDLPADQRPPPPPQAPPASEEARPLASSADGTTKKRDESDVYDRQIRLWGAEAQSKMSSASVLYVNVTGVSAEILKNLVLAGVRASIVDGRPYPESMSNTPTSFLPPPDDVVVSDDDVVISDDEGAERRGGEEGPPAKKTRTTTTPTTTVAAAMKPVVAELNPLLPPCIVDERPASSIPDSYFAQYDVVVASKLGLKESIRIAKSTTKSGGKFYLVDAFGLRGCAVLDLGEGHEFRRELGKDKLSDPTTKGKLYVPLGETLNADLMDATDRFRKVPPKVWAVYRSYLNYERETGKWPSEKRARDYASVTKRWLKLESEKIIDDDDGKKGLLSEEYLGTDEDLERLACLASSEISPVCAVLGGIVGNEIIKAVSGRGEPADNVLLFDGTDGGCHSFVVRDKSKNKSG